MSVFIHYKNNKSLVFLTRKTNYPWRYVAKKRRKLIKICCFLEDFFKPSTNRPPLRDIFLTNFSDSHNCQNFWKIFFEDFVEMSSIIWDREGGGSVDWDFKKKVVIFVSSKAKYTQNDVKISGFRRSKNKIIAKCSNMLCIVI